jgi:quercetin dioxygenase-like cupin family protein
MCEYKSIDKENTLFKLGKNSSKFPTNDHLRVSTDNPNDFKSGPGYENIKIKALVCDKNGYRSYCKIEKGNIEYPHYHNGRYELFVISGKLMYKNLKTNEEFILKKGDYYCNPSNLPHMSICIEKSEVFWMYNKEPDCQCL